MTRRFDPMVFELGYVALETADFAATREHYLEKIGMTETARDGGVAYLSIGVRAHDIVLSPAQGKGLTHLGYAVKPWISLDEVETRLSAAGLSPQRKSDSQPGIAELIEVEVAEGHVVQLYATMDNPAPGFRQQGVQPLRLGHVAVMSPKGADIMRFYDQVLGFWHTDSFENKANFYTCNRDHHVINLVTAPDHKVHHIAFELTDNSAHSRAADALAARGVPTLWGPVRHTAGHNLAGYHHDPDKVMIELYTEMDVFVPEMNMCEPRPWHEHYPMRPRAWRFEDMSTWETQFTFDLAAG